MMKQFSFARIIRYPLYLGYLSVSCLCCLNTAVAQETPEVAVAAVIELEVSTWKEFTGRLEAPQSVEIRPRVSGYVDEVTYTEGSLVKEGDLLFRLDDRAFKAEVSRLKAELEVAQSKQQLAQSEFNRAEDLIKKSAIAQEMLDNRQSQLRQAAGNIAAIKAAIELAALQLDYCSVRAPVAGRVSKAVVTKGNYVTQGQTILTSLVSTDKLYAYFDTDEQTFLDYVRQINAGELPSARTVQYPVQMGLANDNGYPHYGVLDFIDNQVDPKTGTILARAVFSNPDGRLVPGLFTRLRVIASAGKPRILVSDKAVLTDLSNKYVLVLDGENKVQYRAVQTGDKIDELRIVSQGLAAGDKVVISGLQRVRPGIAVKALPGEMASKEVIARIREQQQTVPVLAKPVQPQGE